MFWKYDVFSVAHALLRIAWKYDAFSEFCRCTLVHDLVVLRVLHALRVHIFVHDLDVRWAFVV